MKKNTNYLRLFFRKFSELIVTSVLIAVIYSLFLYYSKMLWHVYLETQVCMKFRASNEDLFSVANSVMHQNLFLLSLETTYTAFAACLAVAVICHLCLLKKWFYDSQRLPGRIILFGLPCALTAALYIDMQYTDLHFVLCLIPALGLFSHCFSFITALGEWGKTIFSNKKLQSAHNNNISAVKQIK